MKKEDNLREQFKQALISTVKVISEEYKLDKNIKKNLSSNNYNFFELDNLNNRQDFINIRAEKNDKFIIKNSKFSKTGFKFKKGINIIFNNN